MEAILAAAVGAFRAPLPLWDMICERRVQRGGHSYT
jgi:hypothetical protein